MAASKERQYPFERTRNIGITAHIDVGKTTLIERILYHTGVNHKIGETYEGTSIVDYMEQERERGITITSVATTCHWALQERNRVKPGVKEYRINIVDTPGHADFTTEVERSFRVLNGAVGVFDTKGGVEPQLKNVWRQADAYHVPCIVSINKMDVMGANFFMTADQIEHRLGKNPVRIQLPIGKENDFKGVIDLMEMQVYAYNGNKGDDILVTDIPEGLKGEADEWHQKMVEQICDLDEEFVEKCLRDEEPSIDELKRVFRKGTCESNAVPVCYGPAHLNKGTQKLLDAVIEYMSSPLDIPAIKGWTLDGEEDERKASDEEPFPALAFKIISDPLVGRLALFRVYSGMLNAGSYVLNSSKEKEECVGRIPQMYVDKRMELEKVSSGDIVAAVGFKATSAGDTICDEQHPITLELLKTSKPVIDIVIESKTRTDQTKMIDVLQKLTEKDPTFHAMTNVETGQIIIFGMGELYLEIIADRLLREYNVEANIGAPQVVYKETFTKPVDVESKYVKQLGGKGQYGHRKVKLEPMDANAEKTYEFANAVTGGAIPKEFITPIDEGIQEAAKSGILGGYPMPGVEATVYDGSYHEVDSPEMASHIAGSLAFKDATQKGGAVLFEPIMKVEVTIPRDYMGFVIGNINSRRGRVKGSEDISGGKMTKAFVPLSEMFGHPTDLRSGTQGRGNYSMFFEKYEPVPKNVADKILSGRK